MPNKGWWGFDFDGTIAVYEGYGDGSRFSMGLERAPLGDGQRPPAFRPLDQLDRDDQGDCQGELCQAVRDEPVSIPS